MNSDLKVVNETKIGKETDERIKRPDLSEQIEDTSDGTGSDDTDVKSAVSGSSRHTGVMKDKESKQETCLSKGHNATQGVILPAGVRAFPAGNSQVDRKYRMILM